ncbi:MAG: T9SS type A sorting domain-containing protein [Saprospiraceae bacterium]|nr:T9SS type A sorting domain-containing protein [Saprospiraceae bacterium]
MKKQFLTIVLLCIATFAVAQKPKVTPQASEHKEGFSLFAKDSWIGRFQKRQEKFAQKIGLTEQQRRSLDTMNDLYVTQRAAFLDDSSLARRDRREDIIDLHDVAAGLYLAKIRVNGKVFTEKIVKQ